MKLKFLGATGTVTGSKYLIEHENKRILIDCGLFQGLKKLRQRNWQNLPIDASELSAVILTHAHIDHSGYLPRLYKQGFKGLVYCTSATKDLCNILLPDCGHLMEEEAKYANKKGFSKHRPDLPLFTAEEAKLTLKYFSPIEYDKSFKLFDGLNLTFRNAGHILGSAHVTLSNASTSITFSGDIGREDDPVLNPPILPDSTNYLVMESTYGNRKHPTTNTEDELAEIINGTIKRGGTIILPAFSVGRTQTVLHYVSRLKKLNKIPDIPVYLNSPMATNVTDIYCRHNKEHKLTDEQCQEMCNVAKYVNSPEESKSLNLNTKPKLIISASGMATGGRVIHHIKAFGSDPKNTLLFTGFQAAGTRGEKITGGSKTVKIHGQEVVIRAEVQNLDNLSAHADSTELINWAKKLKSKPKKTFITHGDKTASNELKTSLIDELGWDCVIPEYLNDFEL